MKKFFIFTILIFVLCPVFSQSKKKFLDFTQMNYNVLSGLFFEMLIYPEKYEGMSIKIKGLFYTEKTEEERIYALVVWDAAGCCPAGISFVPLENLKYPKDFPKENEEIIVSGVIKRFQNELSDGIYIEAEKIEIPQ